MIRETLLRKYLDGFEEMRKKIEEDNKKFYFFPEDFVDKKRKAYDLLKHILRDYSSLTIEEMQKLVSHLEVYPEIVIKEYSNGDISVEKNYTGIFISYVGNEKCEDKEIKIKTEEAFNDLGAFTRKDWVIKSDVGNFTARDMREGKIEVEGNGGLFQGIRMRGGLLVIKGDVDSGLGYLNQRGKITVEGNAKHGVGKLMEGGIITVEGNAGNGVGNGMKGGEIRIYGECESIGKPLGGRIYIQDVLIYKDGKKVK